MTLPIWLAADFFYGLFYLKCKSVTTEKQNKKIQPVSTFATCTHLFNHFEVSFEALLLEPSNTCLIIDT